MNLNLLKNILKKINYYEHICELITWDMETQVPKEGFAMHADALAFFATESFKLSTSDDLKKVLEALLDPHEFSKLDQTWQFIVNKMYKDLIKNARVPSDFYESFTKERSLSLESWQEAKENDDFSIFAPHLEKLICMSKEFYSYTDPDREVYDAMLDTYEEGMDADTIDSLFNELKEGILPLLHKILNKPEPDRSKFEGSFPIESQKNIQHALLDYIGFDWDCGNVGETEHPFTLNFSSKDVRISNHFYEDLPISSMFSAIHEGGHAIFEQNVNPAYDNTVAGSCAFYGLHESQSRFYENILGRNINFWIPIYSDIQEMMPEFKDISIDEFYREINHVKNSLIRTEADELTYCFHIILRYEIEQAIFRQNVPVSELPDLWNQKMQEYLHLTPDSDSDGILQDMHWSDANFGYFPSYLLGSIYDGMFLNAMEKDLGDIDHILREGHLDLITEWLNKKIHRYGSTRLPKDTIMDICHCDVSSKPLIQYFTKKYTKLYDL